MLYIMIYFFATFQMFETPAKAHDKTPLLDSTNKSARSNRSLRSLKTPLSLKKVMTRAFRSKVIIHSLLLLLEKVANWFSYFFQDKSRYNVKKNLDTPLKQS